MKRLTLILLCAISACVSVPRYQEAKTQAVMIESDTEAGSGVVLNEHCVLTAAHVMGEAQDFAVLTSEEKRYEMHPRAKDDKADIGVICAKEDLHIAPVIFASRMPNQWDPVFTIGYPLQNRFVLTEGKWQENDLVTIPDAPGNSGGGVWDADNHYIGFVDAIAIYDLKGAALIDFPHLTQIVDITDIMSFLNNNHIHFRK